MFVELSEPGEGYYTLYSDSKYPTVHRKQMVTNQAIFTIMHCVVSQRES